MLFVDPRSFIKNLFFKKRLPINIMIGRYIISSLQINR